MKCVSALSTAKDTEDALEEVLEAATGATTEGSPADLVLVFASMHHADGLGRIAAEVRRRGLGRHVLGCTGESIVGEDREVEGAPALSLWSIGLPGARLEPIRLAFGDGQFAGWPEWATGPNPPPLLLLGDPFSFPTDAFLKRLHEESPGTPRRRGDGQRRASRRGGTASSSTTGSSRMAPSRSGSTAP